MSKKGIQCPRMCVFLRINHWVVAICMVAAVLTGLYIGYPYYSALDAIPAAEKYVMAWNRLIHFYAAIIFDVSSIMIAYIYLFGCDKFGCHVPWRKLVPNGKNIVEFMEVFLNLVTLNHRKKFDSTHNDSFNIVFFTVFHLLLLFMLFTGLQLYVHGLASGHSSIGEWWPWILHVATDWTLWVFGGNMEVRYVHHFSMYLIIVWVMFHIYYQVWRTIFWREGDISIVIGGEKFSKNNPSA